MINMAITSISTIDAKEEFSTLLNRVSHNKERIVLTRRGKDIAAIVPLEDLYLLEQSQSKSDLEESVEALQEARQGGIVSLASFIDEMGWAG
jgi:prevent-host-death family protein